MKKLLLLLIITFSFAGFSQIEKKFLKQLDYEVIELPLTSNYPWRPSGEEVEFHLSQTLKGDTTGASNDKEFLLFRESVPTGEITKLLKTSYVSNVEYQQFLDWVLDSILMEMIYQNTDPTGNNAIDEKVISSMLIHPDYYYDTVSKKETEFDPSQPHVNRMLFHFDYNGKWRKKIRYEQILPLINSIYLSPSQRYYKNKTLDERRLVYTFDTSEFSQVLVAPDRDVWAKESKHPYDFLYNLANYYSRETSTEYMPVIGLLGTQIKAFLHFEERRLQQKINEKGLNYRVHLTLPTQQELEQSDTAYCNCRMAYVMPEKDMTEQWRITNEEYWEFLSSVQDSILREAIYFNRGADEYEIEGHIIGGMLKHPDVYYDGANLSWTEFDPGSSIMNRSYFHFDYDFNWKKEIEPKKYIPHIKELFENPDKNLSATGGINHSAFNKTKYVYKYYWLDLGRRAQTGDLVWDEDAQMYFPDDIWTGREYDLSGSREPKYNNGVRRHKDMGRFIINEELNVYPGVHCESCNQICEHENDYNPEAEGVKQKCPDGWDKNIETYDFWSNPDETVDNLSYRQALAFYHWKYQVHTWYNKTNSRYFDDLVPTEKQFQKVQDGESMVIPEKEFSFPDPWFRYVIHVYPK